MENLCGCIHEGLSSREMKIGITVIDIQKGHYNLYNMCVYL